MQNPIQPYQPDNYPQPYRRQQPPAAQLIMLLAILYWLSPIDLLPGLPIDDIGVILFALLLRGGLMGGD